MNTGYNAERFMTVASYIKAFFAIIGILDYLAYRANPNTEPIFAEFIRRLRKSTRSTNPPANLPNSPKDQHDGQAKGCAVLMISLSSSPAAQLLFCRCANVPARGIFMGVSDVVGSVRLSVHPSVRPSRLAQKKGFPLCCEVHTCGTESPRHVRLLPLFHLPPSSTPSNTYGLHWREGGGQGRSASSCSLRNDREDQHSNASPPRVFLSFTANDHSCEKGGRSSINGCSRESSSLPARALILNSTMCIPRDIRSWNRKY